MKGTIMTPFKIFMYIWSSCAIFVGGTTVYTATFDNPFVLIVGLGATVIGVLGFAGALMMEND
jgi:hypothetical protein|tara:strand:+ start:356 stop:544 length:189 start_codon:yes stop_codon:yes gene_type:complete